jgi:hypothetical protein
MSLDFKIQKDNKKTIEITPDDLDDINLDDLDGLNIQNELDKSEESLVFTKQNVRGIDNMFGSKNNTKPSPKNNTQKVNVHKDEVKVTVPVKKTTPRPIIEPGSMDLGLDMITNQKKKNVPKEESEVNDMNSSDSKNSRKSNKSLSIDFNDLDKVKNIMDEKSENSLSSKSDDNLSTSSDLSKRIKDKVRQKAPMNDNERRQELLFMFDKLEKKGVKIPQKFNTKSSVDEMEKTYERLKNERDIQNSIRFQRKILMGMVSTMEFLNHSMNPFDIDLDGWSESVMENYSEYDDIFEELYEKYKNKGQISPEVKLIMTLAGSAFYFHLSKMIIKPAQQKMQEMFGNMEAGNMPDMGGMGNMGGFMSGLMNNFMGGGGGGGKSNAPSSGMKGPQGFDDIISKDSGSDIPSVVSVSKNKRSGRSMNL